MEELSLARTKFRERKVERNRVTTDEIPLAAGRNRVTNTHKRGGQPILPLLKFQVTALNSWWAMDEHLGQS